MASSVQNKHSRQKESTTPHICQHNPRTTAGLLSYLCPFSSSYKDNKRQSLFLQLCFLIISEVITEMANAESL